MKKGDLVKGKGNGRWMFDGYGIGIVLASDQLGSVKVYWPRQKFWSVISVRNLRIA